MKVMLAERMVFPRYATMGMSHLTKLKLGGTITHLTRTMELELLNSPRTTKGLRTKP